MRSAVYQLLYHWYKIPGFKETAVFVGRSD